MKAEVYNEKKLETLDLHRNKDKDARSHCFHDFTYSKINHIGKPTKTTRK